MKLCIKRSKNGDNEIYISESVISNLSTIRGRFMVHSWLYFRLFCLKIIIALQSLVEDSQIDF
jgi:hypothetical protein